MTAAAQSIAVYDGRAFLGSFTHKARGDYALANAGGKTIGRAPSLTKAVTAVVAAAKAKLQFH